MNQNDKFTLVEPEYAIFSSPAYGPVFGKGPCDLQIISDTSKDPYTFADIGLVYKNSNYKYGDLESQ